MQNSYAGPTKVAAISHSIRAVTLATVFAATIFATAPSANAESFDGQWSLLVTTRSGPCDQSYRYSVMVRGGLVSYTGSGSVNASGRVSPSGQVSVSVSTRAESAHGSGRLSGGRGAGTWRGQSPTGTCSGVWSAVQS
jgi:hypothetical protein